MGDKQAKEKIDAKNGLESYCYSMKNIDDKLNEVMAWLDTAEHAEKEEFESMQKDLESVCNPIITKMYQATGGMPDGGMGGGMPGGGMPGGGDAGGAGPTIEEVD